jgi:hypothetical protein
MTTHIPPDYDRHDTFDTEAIHGDKGQTGDCCPWCGDPIQVTQEVVGPAGQEPGPVDEWPKRVFHEDCHADALAEVRQDENRSLTEWEDG